MIAITDRGGALRKMRNGRLALSLHLDFPIARIDFQLNSPGQRRFYEEDFLSADPRANAGARCTACGADAENAESAKKNIARLGVGTKAKTTITLNDRSKVKGYIYSAGDDDFVIRDSKTNSSTTLRYADVMSVDDKSSKDLLIGLGAAAVGATIFVLVITQGRPIRPH